MTGVADEDETPAVVTLPFPCWQNKLTRWRADNGTAHTNSASAASWSARLITFHLAGTNPFLKSAKWRFRDFLFRRGGIIERGLDSALGRRLVLVESWLAVVTRPLHRVAAFES